VLVITRTGHTYAYLAYVPYPGCIVRLKRSRDHGDSGSASGPHADTREGGPSASVRSVTGRDRQRGARARAKTRGPTVSAHVGEKERPR